MYDINTVLKYFKIPMIIHHLNMQAYLAKKRFFLFYFLLCSIVSLAVPNSALGETKTDSGTQNEIRKISSAEYNHAVGMLYEWWGLFEMPVGSGKPAHFRDLFLPEVQLSIGAMEIDGLDNLERIFTNLPERKLAHHEPQIQITAGTNQDLIIEAEFIYQVQPKGESATSGITRYRHTISPFGDRGYQFSELTGNLIEQLDSREFVSSYLENKVRATIIKYLAITDDLESDYRALNVLMDDNTEVIGMFDPAKVSFNDRGDNVLRGQMEIATWLQSRKSMFERVAHRLTKVELTQLTDDQIEVAAEVDTSAWPKPQSASELPAEKIQVTVPVTMILDQNNDRYFKIKKLLR